MTLGETVRTLINPPFKVAKLEPHHIVEIYSLGWAELTEGEYGKGEEEMLYFSDGTGCLKMGFYMRKRHVQDRT